MKKKILLIILTLATLSFMGIVELWTHSEWINVFKENKKTETEVSQVAAVVSLIHQSNEYVWPGLDLKEAPTILTFEGGTIYSIGFAKNPDWETQSLAGQEIQIIKEDKWGLSSLKMHPAFDIEGEKSFVFQMDKNVQDLTSARVFAHERFHRYQLDHFKEDLRPIEGGYEDHLNADNIALMKLEDLILYDFLFEENYETRLHLLKDFISVNTERRKIMTSSSIVWESHQQKMEGLADYVSAKMFNDELVVLSNFFPKDENGDFSDYAIKWRHYPAGATLGFALDFLNSPDWKQKIQEGHFLQEILNESLNLEPGEQEERVQEVKRRYDFARISKKTKKKVQKFKDQLNSLMDSYEQLAGPRIRLGHPCQGITGGGNSSRLLYLADGTTLSIKDRSFSSSSDSNWKFETHKIPFLIQTQVGYREFKSESNDQILLNNKPIDIEELLAGEAEYPFISISWKGETFSFSCDKHSGVIVSDGKDLSIYFFSPTPS